MLTRYAFIDPFLRLMGWNTEDPEHVRPEFSTQAGRPDYALLHGGTTPLVFIGAKSLGKQEELQQYISYCVSEGVKYFIATDGARWEVYDTSILKPLVEKKIAEWDILREDPGEVLRKAFIIFRHAPFTGEAQKPITSQDTRREGEVEKVGDPLSKIKPKPREKLMYHEIVFPDGKRYTLKAYADVLLRTVQWLAETNKLRRESLPVKTRGERHIVNTTPHHSSGKPFRSPKEVAGFFVEHHWSTKALIRYSKKILERFHIDPSEVRLV